MGILIKDHTNRINAAIDEVYPKFKDLIADCQSVDGIVEVLIGAVMVNLKGNANPSEVVSIIKKRFS